MFIAINQNLDVTLPCRKVTKRQSRRTLTIPKTCPIQISGISPEAISHATGVVTPIQHAISRAWHQSEFFEITNGCLGITQDYVSALGSPARQGSCQTVGLTEGFYIRQQFMGISQLMTTQLSIHSQKADLLLNNCRTAIRLPPGGSCQRQLTEGD